MARRTIDMMLGATDQSYGVGVWVARIENLHAHLRIIRDHLPEEADWLRNQLSFAMAEADRYLDDPAPFVCADAPMPEELAA